MKGVWAAPAALMLAGCLSMPEREGVLLDRRVGELTALVPRSHPRLLVLAGELEGFRAFVRGLAESGADPRITRDLMPEPTGEPLPAERVSYDAAAATVRLALDAGAVVRLAR